MQKRHIFDITGLFVSKHAVFSEENKILINNLLDLKGHNGKHLVSKGRNC